MNSKVYVVLGYDWAYESVVEGVFTTSEAAQAHMKSIEGKYNNSTWVDEVELDVPLAAGSTS